MFLFHKAFRSAPTHAAARWVTESLYPGREADHSAFGAEVKNVWSCTFTPPCTFMVYSVTGQKDSFTFTRMVLWHIGKLPSVMTHSLCMSHYKFCMTYNLKAWKKLQ